MMDFEEAWETLQIGDGVLVRDGHPPPPKKAGLPYNLWRSHNMKGEVEDKITTDGWRYIRIMVDGDERPQNVEYMSYDIAEGPVHTFIKVGP